ncbi:MULTISPECIES: glycosyltransferase family 2 protein [Eubacteriales]|uniref:Glycosyltransferase involved in cell wall bisynthesis n=1 Tax=Bittarella massiliensis (ex Durand et al. 2017) TaxID=1720313 RepID=A0AAQ1ME80_9FIRM|nr:MULTISPECIES: glycosyltransferase family 2 protein [Eubacteriales]ERI96113.1 putative bactoprenol glucosyl transferase-like protein [Clostridium sp. ATCC 29733]SHG20817.1 Glycosyltransferase involved in cell wall bisynthesis [Bittarella massiliensis (ex Durand et al. 2017)]
MSEITVLVPCYNEQESLPYFYPEICKVAGRMKAAYGVDFSFIFVDDGSKDGTLGVLKELAAGDERVRYLSFSRNFGKEAAIFAGLQHATGDYVAMMDADLQDPPQMLEEMYRGIAEEGYDCVGTRRVTRKGEPKVRSFFARLFYKLINKISDTEIVDGARDFRLMTRQMVDAILSMSEYNRFSKGIFSWVGFSIKWLEYENVERVAGETKWSFWKLLLYSIDGITAFSTAPLAIASLMGVLFCLLAAILIVVVIVKTLVWGDPVAGYPSMMCFIFLIGGIQLLCLGILGQYLSKTYLETKRRPVYILKEDNKK